MTAIECRDVTYRYDRRVEALHGVTLSVPAGAIYGLIGPNAAGKSTLLQCCAGIRNASGGTITVFGHDVRVRDPIATGALGYVAEAVKLPQTMTLARLEAYIAPLHARWDAALAASLRARFALDPSRRISTFSKGEHMKAALLCALAPRPRLLLMDEPFTGMDVMVKDDLVRGLLAAATDAETTIVVASHDLTELEAVVDYVGMLIAGRIAVSGSIEQLRERFRRVTVVAEADVLSAAGHDEAWLGVERIGRRLSFMADASRTSVRPEAMQLRFPGADQIDLAEPSLKEMFATLSGRAGQPSPVERSA